MTHDEVITWLWEQKTVDFVTTISNGEVILVMTKDDRLVKALEDRGATSRWYDRTEWSTRNGKEKARQQCEVLLGPMFWARQEEEVATA
jgi:hypothetical protein